jgi:hypothetical protein
LRLPAVPLFILLVWIGLPAAAWPPPGSPPVPASDDKRGAAQSAEESHTLEPGKSIERELSGSRSHFYKTNLTSGQYLQIAVSQQGIDVLVALYTPDGKKIDDVDSEHATAGSENISAIAEAAGAYMVEVRSAEKTAQTGHYEIKVEELRAATAEDKYRVAGDTAYREARRLENGTTEEKGRASRSFMRRWIFIEEQAPVEERPSHATASAGSICRGERRRRRWRSSTKLCRSSNSSVTATEKLPHCWELRESRSNAEISRRLANPLNRLSA